MNPRTYDALDKKYEDEELSERDYLDFVHWLENKAISDLRSSRGKKAALRQALLRYFCIGYRANLTPGELWDYLSISSENILERTGLSEHDQEWALETASKKSFKPEKHQLSDADYEINEHLAHNEQQEDEKPFWNPGVDAFSNFNPVSKALIKTTADYLRDIVFGPAYSQKQCIDRWPTVDDHFDQALVSTFNADDITTATQVLGPKIIEWRNGGAFKLFESAVHFDDPDLETKIAALMQQGGVAATAIITGINKNKTEIETPIDPFYVWMLKVATRLFVADVSVANFAKFTHDHYKYLAGSAEFRVVSLAKELPNWVEADKDQSWIAQERQNLARLLKQASDKVSTGYASYRHIRPGTKASSELAKFAKQVERLAAK